MSTNTLDRLSFIDILKIGATFAIVLLHVSALYVRMDAQLLNPSGTLPYIINSLTRVALPLFMMATGTLLLRDRYRFNLKNKFTFIAKTYIFWSALYICADQVLRLYVGDELLSPAEMIVGWIRGPYHFWYLQMLLGFYLLMPLLARLKGLQTLSYAMLLLFVITYIYNPLAPHLCQCVCRDSSVKSFSQRQALCSFTFCLVPGSTACHIAASWPLARPFPSSSESAFASTSFSAHQLTRTAAFFSR